ncbi:MAG: Csu type fimbrial protein [Gammaproteobacteria bacterium]
MIQLIHCQSVATIACARLGAVKHRFFTALLSLVLSLLADSAYGVSCSVNTSGVSFGVYDVFSPVANDSAGNIHVSCSDLLLVGVSYEILLSTGGGSYASRSMASGIHTLGYNLYTDINRTTVWGDGSAGTAKVTGSFLLGIFSQNRDHPVYGRIPAQQNGYVGSYSDIITVTINY